MILKIGFGIPERHLWFMALFYVACEPRNAFLTSILRHYGVVGTEGLNPHSSFLLSNSCFMVAANINYYNSQPVSQSMLIANKIPNHNSTHYHKIRHFFLRTFQALSSRRVSAISVSKYNMIDDIFINMSYVSKPHKRLMSELRNRFID